MGATSINFEKDVLTSFDQMIADMVNKDSQPLSRSQAINTMLKHMLTSPGYVIEILESYGFIKVVKH